MNFSLVILCGVACGIVAGAPLFLQLQRGETDIGKGFGSVIGAFLGIQLLMFAVLWLWPELVAPFGVSTTLAFLAVETFAVVSWTLRQPRD